MGEREENNGFGEDRGEVGGKEEQQPKKDEEWTPRAAKESWPEWPLIFTIAMGILEATAESCSKRR